MIARIKVGFATGWIAAVPFLMLHAPRQWQWLALVEGAALGILLYHPEKGP